MFHVSTGPEDATQCVVQVTGWSQVYQRAEWPYMAGTALNLQLHVFNASDSRLVSCGHLLAEAQSEVDLKTGTQWELLFQILVLSVLAVELVCPDALTSCQECWQP